MKRNEPFDCPNCGAEVPAGAKACPECGSDEKTGWNEEEAIYDGTDIEEPKKFDYNKWLEKEGLKLHRLSAKRWAILLVAVVLLAALLLMFLKIH